MIKIPLENEDEEGEERIRVSQGWWLAFDCLGTPGDLF